MGISSSSQIVTPEIQTLDTIGGTVNVLTLLQKAQADPTFIPGLAASLASAYALSQAEKDERDSAVAQVTQAKSDMAALQSQYAELQQSITDTKNQSDAALALARTASDNYISAQNDLYQKKKDALTAYSKELDAREIEVADREAAATTAETANAALKTQLDTQQTALVNFSNALRQIVPTAPTLEQFNTAE